MHRLVLAVLLPVALLIAACSSGATAPTAAPSVVPSAVATATPTAPTAAPSMAPSAVPQAGEITVVLSDTMRYAPDAVTVKAGDKVTFVLRNEGVIVHEFFVGTEEQQVDHAAEMAMGGMSHGHDNALSLKAGETGSLTMTFAKAESLLIGCHEPGHYEAGMKATLTVVD
jgi:uncharacterized cupredoxin-like copper-binding protein